MLLLGSRRLLRLIQHLRHELLKIFRRVLLLLGVLQSGRATTRTTLAALAILASHDIPLKY